MTVTGELNERARASPGHLGRAESTMAGNRSHQRACNITTPFNIIIMAPGSLSLHRTLERSSVFSSGCSQLGEGKLVSSANTTRESTCRGQWTSERSAAAAAACSSSVEWPQHNVLVAIIIARRRPRGSLRVGAGAELSPLASVSRPPNSRRTRIVVVILFRLIIIGNIHEAKPANSHRPNWQRPLESPGRRRNHF